MYVDSSDNLLWGIQKDGNIYFGAGIPEQIRIKIDDLYNKKVDKVEGSTLIPEQYVQEVDNPEYIRVYIDSSSHVLESITTDGVKQINIPIKASSQIETQSAFIYSVDNPEYIKVELDSENKVINAVRKDGTVIVGGINISDLKKEIDSNVIAIEYDSSTYGIYSITGDDSNVSLTMDEDGHIYKETIID